MNFWWVNQGKSQKHQVDGGFIWSPKVRIDGRRHGSYDTLKETEIGDIVFSFGEGKIRALGTVDGACIDTQKPPAFGADGEGWAQDGQSISVKWEVLKVPFKPGEFEGKLKPLFAKVGSPDNVGPREGMQGTYLAQITQALATALFEIAEEHDSKAVEATQLLSNDYLTRKVRDDAQTPETTREAVIQARVGQGIFRTKLIALEGKCRLTNTCNADFLIASHIKPWAMSDNAERLNAHNGLLLAPHVDRLFDKGWISFSNEGGLLTANVHAEEILREWRLLDAFELRPFSEQQKAFLDYHRKNIFRKMSE